MKANWLRTLASRTVLRISLAILMIVIGLATLSQPIFSDSSWRASAAPAAQAVTPETTQPQAFVYRSTVQGDTLTQVERSDDGGKTWHAVASIPEKVSDVMP